MDSIYVIINPQLKGFLSKKDSRYIFTVNEDLAFKFNTETQANSFINRKRLKRYKGSLAVLKL